MDHGLSLFPASASTMSGSVDLLCLFILMICTFFTLLIGGLVLFFAAKYRRRAGHLRATQNSGSLFLEIAWTGIPLAIALVIFVWGARLYLIGARPPERALDILVTAKQWMWKLEHPEGQREINELHVPLGVKVRLSMTSEDVIHSFYVPAFRMKQDVLPGRYSQAWFEATRAGAFHLFCAEYCGTQHSGMIGTIHVLEPADYAAWLAGAPMGEAPEVAGKKLFEALRCDSCHLQIAQPRGPPLAGLFGREVKLRDGGTLIADENYLRESILRPLARIVAGYEPVMPAYEGQVSEEQVARIVAWLKTLKQSP